MRKISLILLALGITSLLLALSWHQFKQRKEILEPVSIAGEIAPPAQSLKVELENSLALPELDQPTTAAPICVEFWRHVVNVSLSEWIHDVGVIGWNQPSECKGKMSAALDLISDRVALSCGKGDNCDEALLAYRSRLADELTSPRHNFVDMPLALVISKVISEIHGVGDEAHRSLPEFLTLVETLINRDLKFYSLKKLAIAALVVRETQESESELKQQVSDRLNKLIESARTDHGDDPDVLKMELHRQVELGESGEPEIANFVVKFPKSAIGHYFLASTQCRAKIRDECQKSLETAISLDPENEMFRNSLSQLKAKTSDDDLVAVSFETGILLDILNW